MTTKKQAEVPATPPAPPAPTKEEVLLTEIRDLLKEKNKRIPVIEVADSWDMEKAAKEIIQEVI